MTSVLIRILVALTAEVKVPVALLIVKVWLLPVALFVLLTL